MMTSCMRVWQQVQSAQLRFPPGDGIEVVPVGRIRLGKRRASALVAVHAGRADEYKAPDASSGGVVPEPQRAGGVDVSKCGSRTCTCAPPISSERVIT